MAPICAARNCDASNRPDARASTIRLGRIRVGLSLKNKEINMSMTREQGLRWTLQGLMVLLVLVAVFAVTQYMRVSELESAVSKAQEEAQRASQDMAAARKKMQDEL